jgi:hypothetical protein
LYVLSDQYPPVLARVHVYEQVAMDDNAQGCQIDEMVAAICR